VGLMIGKPGYHGCPRHGCSAHVPDERYACWKHWRELSKETRDEITRTRRRHVLDPERRAAFRMADADWRQ
jgi:hypothetical protein